MARKWSIRIVKLADGTVAFQPDVLNAQPNQPLGVNRGDNVTWSNETDDAHWPVGIAPPGFLTKDIPPDGVSRPKFNVQTSVTYRCLHHPLEQGMIVVTEDLILPP